MSLLEHSIDSRREFMLWQSLSDVQVIIQMSDLFGIIKLYESEKWHVEFEISSIIHVLPH